MKAPNGYGSVYKLKGNRRNPWTARITTGKKLSKDGTRFFQSYAYLGYYRTRKEAQDALADYNLSKHTTQVKSGRKTLLDVYTEWSEKDYPNLSDRTVHVYRNGWNVLKPLYDIELDSITLQMIEDVFKASGKNKPVLQISKQILKSCFRYARKYDWTNDSKVNMLDYVDIEAGNPDARPHKRIPDDLIRQLWERDDLEAHLVLMLVYSGLRVSEFVRLEREDIDLQQRSINVKDAKTASGVRLVPIHEKTLPFWKTFLESNLWRSVGILGTGADASRATSVRTIFKNYLHDYSPHDARHSCVSMLQEIPCPKPIIQSIVGHKGKDVTDTFYTHINLETKLEWINKI